VGHCLRRDFAHRPDPMGNEASCCYDRTKEVDPDTDPMLRIPPDDSREDVEVDGKDADGCHAATSAKERAPQRANACFGGMKDMVQRARGRVTRSLSGTTSHMMALKDKHMSKKTVKSFEAEAQNGDSPTDAVPTSEPQPQAAASREVEVPMPAAVPAETSSQEPEKVEVAAPEVPAAPEPEQAEVAAPEDPAAPEPKKAEEPVAPEPAQVEEKASVPEPEEAKAAAPEPETTEGAAPEPEKGEAAVVEEPIAEEPEKAEDPDMPSLESFIRAPAESTADTEAPAEPSADTEPQAAETAPATEQSAVSTAKEAEKTEDTAKETEKTEEPATRPAS